MPSVHPVLQILTILTHRLTYLYSCIKSSASEFENNLLIEMTDSSESRELWESAKAHGISRRRFLALLSAGGAAAVIAACGDYWQPSGRPQAPAIESTPPKEDSPWFKDAAPFIRRDDKGLESRLENMQGLITPRHLFFVRNNSVSVGLDASNWRLSIEGDAVTAPVTLSYEQIRNLPSRTLVSYLECAGNHRAMFDIVKGQAAQGTQWGTGAIGNGEWTGASLRDVLILAGITNAAVSVLLIGQDTESPEGGFRRVIPVEKAMHSDTLLAYALNGDDLPKDHGYPLRALLPGWVGSSSIKWLHRIVVSSETLWTRNNTTSYVLIGDDYLLEGEAQGEVVSTQTIKSALALPWPAELTVGSHRIHGYAHSPASSITTVEWSDDSGSTWNAATVLEPQVQYSWARFEFAWNAQPGEHTIMTRATDAQGNTQPDAIPFNEKGYLFNQPVPHPIIVS